MRVGKIRQGWRRGTTYRDARVSNAPMIPAIMLVRLRKDLEARIEAQDKRIIELERQLAMFRPVSRRKVVSAGLFIERSAGKQ